MGYLLAAACCGACRGGGVAFTLSVSLSKLFSAAADSRSSFFSSSGTSTSGGSDMQDANLSDLVQMARDQLRPLDELHSCRKAETDLLQTAALHRASQIEYLKASSDRSKHAAQDVRWAAPITSGEAPPTG